MSESDFDIDTMGKLTLDYFERDSSCSGESSTGSSPSYDYLESPVSSPDERSTPESLSDSSSMYSEEEPPERVLPREGKAKRSVGVKETVSKRNARERKRVKLISEGFSTLRKHVLVQPNNRKLPKLEILRRAIDYIHGLQSMLDESDMQLEMENQMRKTENCHVQPTHEVRYFIDLRLNLSDLKVQHHQLT